MRVLFRAQVCACMQWSVAMHISCVLLNAPKYIAKLSVMHWKTWDSDAFQWNSVVSNIHWICQPLNFRSQIHWKVYIQCIIHRI
jgi:hypothetical protein